MIEFDQLFVHGREAAGGYGFIFSLRGGRQAGASKLSIFELSLSITIAQPPRPLATAIPSTTQVIRCHPGAHHSEQIYFETVFTREQVNALEEFRQQNDVGLVLDLRALIISGDELIPSHDRTEITIPREQWLTALNNAGFRNTLLFEIPLPAASEDVMALYSKAQEFIETGHYQDAVMQCRRIVECIETLRGDKKLARSANEQAHSSARQAMTGVERLLSLREQLKNVCQVGAHGTEPFSRSQARAVVGMTMTLLAEPTVGFFHDPVSEDELG